MYVFSSPPPSRFPRYSLQSTASARNSVKGALKKQLRRLIIATRINYFATHARAKACIIYIVRGRVSGRNFPIYRNSEHRCEVCNEYRSKVSSEIKPSFYYRFIVPKLVFKLRKKTVFFFMFFFQIYIGDGGVKKKKSTYEIKLRNKTSRDFSLLTQKRNAEKSKIIIKFTYRRLRRKTSSLLIKELFGYYKQHYTSSVLSSVSRCVRVCHTYIYIYDIHNHFPHAFFQFLLFETKGERDWQVT